eukprot:442114_1
MDQTQSVYDIEWFCDEFCRNRVDAMRYLDDCFGFGDFRKLRDAHSILAAREWRNVDENVISTKCAKSIGEFSPIANGGVETSPYAILGPGSARLILESAQNEVNDCFCVYFRFEI